MRYVFGEYTLDVHRDELRAAGGVVRLDRQVFAVLAYLVQHHERVVRRQELFERLWPGRLVSEAALERCIAVARRAVGDSGRRQRVIQTVHGRGYRFVAPVEECLDAPPGTAPLATPPLPDLPEASPPLPPVGGVTCGGRPTAVRVSLTTAHRTAPPCACPCRPGNAGRSRCCVARWRTPRRWRTGWAWRRSSTWCRRSTPWPRSVCSAMRAPSSRWGTKACWRCLACRWRRRSTRGAPCGPHWNCNVGYGRRLPGREIFPDEALTARVGVHTGWVVVGSHRDEVPQCVVVGGDTTQGAMRLQALADPGTLLVSDTTLRLLRSTVCSTAYGLVHDARPRGTPHDLYCAEP